MINVLVINYLGRETDKTERGGECEWERRGAQIFFFFILFERWRRDIITSLVPNGSRCSLKAVLLTSFMERGVFKLCVGCEIKKKHHHHSRFNISWCSFVLSQCCLFFFFCNSNSERLPWQAFYLIANFYLSLCVCVCVWIYNKSNYIVYQVCR